MALNENMKPHSKRSLIEFGAILRRNGCGHKEDQLLCRVCAEELADQIATLGNKMIHLRKVQDELAQLNTMIPKFMFTQD